ncbi:FAD-dependent oxidoreductase [Sinanaerobacter sp. ZZT-01]|uniref:FAD-dependent oxidoreductase n=1 Tax=Sinanaerobacter sp. ZZT-01 TaxID=3111540 RepID=UPI002D791F43|nr:FAD-dependent oxidoreductase [Sinanaerobacter sp. ZZT-01]WRR94544.1 FAD-dependent oxidoreductase [Sinanaerobacter sp. ZZT-01]
MNRVIVIGGGWSGCAASLAAKKAGADVVLVEKTDLLLGLGNVGGIMRNNGRYTAAEENIALGAGELFAITDALSRHKNVDFPGHRHASLYDVIKVEPHVRRFLEEQGIEIHTIARAIDVELQASSAGSSAQEQKKCLKSITLADGTILEGDFFVECTGSTGPMGNCLTYGNGCCMCILRCPSFGPRVSITQKAGLNDIMGQRKDGAFGAFSGSGKLEKESLSSEIQRELNEKGVAIIPLPPEQITKEKLDLKVCQQYALEEFADNIVLLDTGYAKIMTPFFPLEKLRRVPGMENARYIDPYAGGKGNSIRYLSVAERENNMMVDGIENLLCGGEKSGLFVGHTEAITTGTLAGYNAARLIKGMRPLELPPQLALGDIISYANEKIKTKDGLMKRYTFAGAEYFERMKEKGLYTTDKKTIQKRAKKYDLANIYKEKIL